jgi:hypothetical protein
MQPQTIPTESGTNGAAQPAPARGADSFVDSALEALGDLAGPDNNNGRAPAKPRTEPQRPDGEDADAEVEEPLGTDAEDEDDEHGEQDADGDAETHDPRGSKEEPFSVKDLPADKFIELKVDGEKTVVSLSELAAGYIREQTFSQRINRTKALADEAQAHLTRAKETQTSVREALREFVNDPDQLYDYFLATEDREKVLEAVAQRYAGQLRRFRENPQERLYFQRERDQARLQAEREHFEREKQQELQARQQQEQQERAFKVFKPGWEAGLKKAGFPTPTPELWEEVQVRCNQRHRAGHPVTSDDVAEFVHRAAKLLELPPRSAKKPKPAPAAPLKDREAQRRRKDNPWADAPQSKRTKDPDYFLRNLRGRDFR